MHAGDLIAGRYRLDSEIGAGPTTRVFLARDLQLARRVALKVFVVCDFDGLLDSIERAAAFSNSGALTILDSGIDEYPYVVTEYCPGGSLADEISAMGPLGYDRVAEIARSACETLAASHAEGLLHLGLRPANILFDESDRFRVADFGLSFGDRDATLAPGTLPAYLAPEQVEGAGLGPATDLFSLGIVLAEAVAGRRVVAGSAGISVLGGATYRPGRRFVCDDELGHAIERATRMAPFERFQSAAEMAAAFGSPRVAAMSRHAPGTGRSALAAVAGGGISFGGSGVGLLERPLEEEPTSDSSWPASLRVYANEDATDVEACSDDDGDDIGEVGIVIDDRHDPEFIDEPRHGRGRRRWRRAALVLTIVVLAAAGAAYGVAANRKAPDFLGRSLDAARTDARSAGTGTEVVATLPSDAYPKGIVIGQSPPPGGSLGFRAPVRLTLSSGPLPVAVPKVEGMTIEGAVEALGRVRLVPVVSSTGFSAKAAGEVLSQDPRETSAEPGSSVLLNVSAGPEPIAVPDLTGKPAKDAEAELKGLGAEVNQQQEYSDSVKSGIVISVSPEPGVRIRAGHPVTVVVSKGPRLIPVPDVRGSRVTDATAKLQALGFVVKLVQIVGQERVVAQDPAPGVQAKKGQTVTLTTGP